MPFPYTLTQHSRKTLLSIPITLMILTTLTLAAAIVHAQSPDFSLTPSPSNLCVNPGVDGVATITLQSVNGFAGTVNLGSSVDPSVTNGPTLSATPSSETLAAGQSVSFDLSITTTTSTPLYTYSIRVSGLSGATFHQATVLLTVAAGCSVGGVVLPTAGLAPANSYLVYGLVIAGLVGIVGATLAVSISRRKPAPAI